MLTPKIPLTFVPASTTSTASGPSLPVRLPPGRPASIVNSSSRLRAFPWESGPSTPLVSRYTPFVALTPKPSSNSSPALTATLPPPSRPRPRPGRLKSSLSSDRDVSRLVLSRMRNATSAGLVVSRVPFHTTPSMTTSMSPTSTSPLLLRSASHF